MDHPDKRTDDQKYWFDFTEEAYRIGLDAYVRVARENLPARLQEQALVDYFASKSSEVSSRIGKQIDMTLQKPYIPEYDDLQLCLSVCAYLRLKRR